MRYIAKRATTKRRLETSASIKTRSSMKWVDPFPEVHGTLPEKMVYAELSRLGIPFLFLNDISFAIPELELVKEYQVDFVFPSIKMIVEVQGAYFHSMQKTIEADAYKMAIYETTGWQVRAWWDYEIIAGVQQLVMNEPLLLSIITRPGSTLSSEMAVQKRTKVDTSQGIRTMNARRFKAKAVKVNKRKLRKGIFSI